MKKLKHFLMHRSRTRKYSDFIDFACLSAADKVLDVGVADKEYSPHDNFLEKNFPYPENITALSIFPLDEFKKRYPKVTPVCFAGGKFPFFDNQFKVAHSNAVIEHVGGFFQQVDFVKELARVGQCFYFTTPSRIFPFETHTNVPVLHYLPKVAFDALLHRLGKSWATGDYMNLLSKNDLVKILENAQITNYRILTQYLLGFPLHYTVTGQKG